MEIEIIKDFVYQSRKFKTGTKTLVGANLGRQWIADGFAKQTTGFLKMEAEMIERALPKKEGDTHIYLNLGQEEE